MIGLKWYSHWWNSGMNIMGVANQFLIGFKSYFTRWNQKLALLLGWKPMTTQMIGPRTESATAMLPNSHDIKWTPTSLLCSKINASLNPFFYGSFYLRWMWIHIMTYNWSCRLKNCMGLTQKWSIHTSPLPLWSRENCGGRLEGTRTRGFRWLTGNRVSRTRQHSCTKEVTGNVEAYTSPV